MRRSKAVEILPYRPLWPVARSLIGRVPGVAFLDSAGDHELARWSILGWSPRRVVAWPAGRPGAVDRLRLCFPAGPAADDPIPFFGGWIGWFAYDLGRHFEPALSGTGGGEAPDFVLGEYDAVLVEDRVEKVLYAAGSYDAAGSFDDAASARRLIERARQGLVLADGPGTDAAAVDAPADGPDAGAPATGAPAADAAAADGVGIDLRREQRYESSPMPAGMASEMGRAAYLRRVETILAEIRAGNVYQANLSHRFGGRTDEPSGRIYERLRDASPAPFACYLGLPGGPEILSASPELFVRRTADRIETRPIKGTRPRGRGADDDARQLEALASSPKERAELLMITDLLRNDLGKVARFGSVHVERLRGLESHATVHHAYSAICAELRRDVGPLEILAAVFPGGSVTGAPKIRAMTILDDLEPVRRGPYTGSAGFIGYDGRMALNILIRTIVRSGSSVHYQVGGGIVADSEPEAEYAETLAKGAALRRVLEGRAPAAEPQGRRRPRRTDLERLLLH